MSPSRRRYRWLLTSVIGALVLAELAGAPAARSVLPPGFQEVDRLQRPRPPDGGEVLAATVACSSPRRAASSRSSTA